MRYELVQRHNRYWIVDVTTMRLISASASGARHATNAQKKYAESKCRTLNQRWERLRDRWAGAYGSAVATNPHTAATHHELHGDMDGHTCLLSACAIHYPLKNAGSAATPQGAT